MAGSMKPENQTPSDGHGGRRKDFRLSVAESMPLIADCHTASGPFRERVLNVSSKGAFLATTRKLTIGQEIAMTIPLAGSKATIRATGVVVRADPTGFGIEFRVIFRY
jgi:hypothetical protein